MSLSATGNFNNQTVTYTRNGFRTGLYDTPMPLGLGVYSSPLYNYVFTPMSGAITTDPNTPKTLWTGQLAVNAVAGAGYTSPRVYCSALIAGGTNGNIPLNTGANYPQSITYQGFYPVIEFDCQRSLAITVSGDTNNFNIQYTGWDERGVYLEGSDTFTGVGNTRVYNTKKTLKYLKSASCVQAPSADFALGMGTNFGFPVFVPACTTNVSTPYLINGKFVANYTVTPGVDFYNTANFGAQDTSDARGFVSFPVTTGFPLPLTLGNPYILFYVQGADSYFNQQLMNGDVGANFRLTQVTGNGAVPGAIKGSTVRALTQYDLTGVQWPGDFTQNGGNFQNTYTFNT